VNNKFEKHIERSKRNLIETVSPCLPQVIENKKNLSEYSLFLCRDLNRHPIEYYHDLEVVRNS
jgi:hypothetical protein